jgi:membrane protease YdiL (CAAX protease family)
MLLVAQAPIWIAYLFGADLLISCLYGGISILLMILLPLFVSAVFSEYASFDKTFLPARKKYYFIVVPLALLLTAVSAFVGYYTHKAGFNVPLKFGSFPMKLLYFGFFFSIVIVPIAEEIFWRGYVLDQFRKFLHSGTALLMQAILFSVYHIPVWGIYCIGAFFVGLALGYWRIRHRALLPLILTHSVVNALYYLPIMAELIRLNKHL